MPSSFRSGLVILVAALLITSLAFAFNGPLSDEAVREAYFLGQRRDDKTAQFLETYRRYPPVPKSGPHVYAVELFTPYAQAVEASSKHGGNYSAQQARLDYQARGDSLRVGVYVRYIPNQVPGQTGTRKDFQVRLTLDGETLEPRSLRYESMLAGTGGGKGGGSRSTGFIIWQEYQAPTSTSPGAIVTVDTPDGQHVAVSFDLSRLR
jgi:hypothetical protein